MTIPTASLKPPSSSKRIRSVSTSVAVSASVAVAVADWLFASMVLSLTRVLNEMVLLAGAANRAAITGNDRVPGLCCRYSRQLQCARTTAVHGEHTHACTHAHACMRQDTGKHDAEMGMHAHPHVHTCIISRPLSTSLILSLPPILPTYATQTGDRQVRVCQARVAGDCTDQRPRHCA